MSGYASKAEFVEVIKRGIEIDYNGIGYPKDASRFNIAGICRDVDLYHNPPYGWRTGDHGDFEEILRANYRPQHRAKTTIPAKETPTAHVGRHVKAP
jgi:hypothetical protein